MSRRDPLNFLLLAFDYLFKRWHLFCGKIRFRVLCALWGAHHGKGGVFAGKTILITLKRGDVEIGENARFISGLRMNPIVAATPTVITTANGGHVKIGDGCRFTSPFIGSAESVTIGNNVMVSGGVKIMDTNFHSIDPVARRTKVNDSDELPLPVEIGDDVFIGLNATIMKGSKIGARTIVAANSVVFGLDIPPDSIVSGNPASYKTIRIPQSHKH